MNKKKSPRFPFYQASHEKRQGKAYKPPTFCHSIMYYFWLHETIFTLLTKSFFVPRILRGGTSIPHHLTRPRSCGPRLPSQTDQWSAPYPDMARLYGQVVNVVSKPPEQRTPEDAISIVGWFRKKSRLFGELASGKPLRRHRFSVQYAGFPQDFPKFPQNFSNI